MIQIKSGYFLKPTNPIKLVGNKIIVVNFGTDTFILIN